MDRKIHNIFPRPLAENRSFLGPNHCKKVLEHLKSLEYNSIDKSEPNKSFISSSKDVLSQLPEIKDIILNDFLQYIEYSMKITDAKFKIGSSWGTKAPPGTDSNWHIHSNYFYSGVYYPEKCTGIMFKDQLVDHYIFDFSAQTPYNSNAYTHYPEKNSLVYFRSNLFHKIMKNTDTTDRYSLAFNIMPFGEYGTGDGIITVK